MTAVWWAVAAAAAAAVAVAAHFAAWWVASRAVATPVAAFDLRAGDVVQDIGARNPQRIVAAVTRYTRVVSVVYTDGSSNLFGATEQVRRWQPPAWRVSPLGLFWPAAVFGVVGFFAVLLLTVQGS